MSYSDPTVGLSAVEPHVKAAIDAVDVIIDDINAAFRKEDRLMVLQHFDLLNYSPHVEEVAHYVAGIRPDCQLLEAAELAVNVLDDGFLVWRVQQLSPRHAQLVQEEELRQRGDTKESSGATSSRASPGSLPAVQAQGATTAAAFDFGATCAATASAAANVDATARALYEVERRLEHAFALGLLSAQAQNPDEDDHHREMLEDFELKFSRPSELLRSVLRSTEGPCEVCLTYRSTEGNITADVLSGALLKHPPRTTDEIAALVALARENDVPMTLAVAEVLERCYVRCMKAEGAEYVFHRMTNDLRLVPLTARPFAMLFNAKSLTMVRSVLDYYELMLDYGISPEPSLLRILCKQTSGMEYATLHFTLRVKTYEQQQQQQEEEGGVSNAAAGAAPPSPPDSRRKNERTYFEKRLEALAEQAPDTPLLEAMKVIHRAEVEGTSLEGDTLILTALLRLFCNGTTPVADLVKPFSHSPAYLPRRVTVAAAPAAAHSHTRSGGAGAAARGGRRGSAGSETNNGVGGRFAPAAGNAFDFGLEDATLETLDELAGGGGLEDMVLEAGDDAGLLGAGGDDDLEELAHRQIVETEGGLPAARTAQSHHHHHHPDLDDLDDDGDELDDLDEDPAGAGTPEAILSGDRSRAASPHSPAVSSGKPSAGATAATTPAAAPERSRRTPRHVPGIASPSEEAAYVLDVLASYGSLPDNNVLNTLANQYVNRGNSGIGVVQQVTQALFRAGHESRGAVESVRSSSCHCLVRYYIRRHQRGKLTQLVRSFVEQCYEYNHIFKVSWSGDTDTRSSGYHLRNNITFTAFATAAMKAGPLDWALGLLALALCMSNHPIADNTRARLYQVSENESHGSPHRDVFRLFEKCSWDRDRILAEESFLPAAAFANDRNGGANGGDGAANGGMDIFTASQMDARNVSSHDNPRGLAGHATLDVYMHNALREMNVERDVARYFKDRLAQERREAIDRLRSGEKGGGQQSQRGGGRR